MSDDTVDNLLFLVFRDVVNVSSLMELRLTAAITFCSVKYLIYIYLVIAARILVSGSKWPMKVHLDFGCDRVIPTVSHLRNRIVFMAPVTLDVVQVRPNLPIDLFPRNSIRLSNVGYEFLKIPGLVDHVLGSHLTVGVNEGSAFSAREYFSLFLCEEFVAVGTFIEVVLILLEEQFKFLHEQPTDNFVFTLLEYV